jgi:hypothetical protein
MPTSLALVESSAPNHGYSVKRPHLFALALATIACLALGGMRVAQAQCAALPYSLTNGQSADATQAMANLDALLNCINTGQYPANFSNIQFSGPGGGVITMQNPSATANYNLNLPATAGSAGQLRTSGGGASNPHTWTTLPTADILEGSGLSGFSGLMVGAGLAKAGGNLVLDLTHPNTWTGPQSFGEVIGTVSTQTGTSYTLAASDCGTTIRFTNAAAITVTTLNSLPVACAIAIEQAGAAQVTIAAGTGATQHSAHGYSKTFGQYAILGLFVDTNSGGSAANIVGIILQDL